VWEIPADGERALFTRSFWLGCRSPLVSPLEHCAHANDPHYQATPQKPTRIFSLMRRGLIPYWAKDPAIGLKTINAMSETAAVKPAFRDAFKYRRLFGPGRRILRVGENRTEAKVALQLRHAGWFGVCLCGTVGPLAPAR
jgi:hypothetical protein